MDREPRITDVGAEEEPRQRPPWLLPVLVGIGGFALGLLVATTISSAGPSEGTATLPAPDSTQPRDSGTATTADVGPVSTTSSPSSTTSTTLVQLTIEERVPGFEGTLYFINPVSASALDDEIVIWSSEAVAPTDSGLPAGVLALDASGTRLAVQTGFSLDRDFTGGVISLFWNLDSSHPPFRGSDSFVGSGVGGFVWHANQPGRLAWTQQDESGSWSFRFGVYTDPVPATPTVVAEFDEPVFPAYWDEEMAVLLKFGPSDGVPETVILDGDGQSTAPPGAVLSGVLPGGGLLMGSFDTGESFLFDPVSKEESRPEWFSALGDIWGLRLDPTGNRALVVIETADETAEVLIIDEDGPIQTCFVESRVFDGHWSSDGRWVVMDVETRNPLDVPSIWFLDTDSCQAIRVPYEEDPGFLAAVGR